MNAVERVARVLHAEDSADLWEEATAYAKAMHRRAARAAIAAHKEALAAAGFIIVPHERSEGEPTERPGAGDIQNPESAPPLQAEGEDGRLAQEEKT